MRTQWFVLIFLWEDVPLVPPTYLSSHSHHFFETQTYFHRSSIYSVVLDENTALYFIPNRTENENRKRRVRKRANGCREMDIFSWFSECMTSINLDIWYFRHCFPCSFLWTLHDAVSILLVFLPGPFLSLVPRIEASLLTAFVTQSLCTLPSLSAQKHTELICSSVSPHCAFKCEISVSQSKTRREVL